GLLGPVFDLDEVYRFTHGDPVAWNAPEQLHKDVFSAEGEWRGHEGLRAMTLRLTGNFSSAKHLRSTETIS
ncbi:MAG: hypothetical protein ACKOC6_02165, partial [bacterium]